MALARVKTWVAGEVLTAADLNGEFNNVLNNAISLVFPSTGTMDFGGQRVTNLSTGTVAVPGLAFNSDPDTGLASTGTNTVGLVGGAASGVVVTSSVSSLTPGGNAVVVVTSSIASILSVVTVTTSAATVLSGIPTVHATSTGGTPAAHGLYADNVVKGWVHFSASTGSPAVIKGSFNVSSVGYNAVGNYSVNWDRDFGSTGYVVNGIAGPNATPVFLWPLSAPSTAASQIGVHTSSGAIDLGSVMVMAIGTQ